MEDMIDFPCSADWLAHYHRIGLTPRKPHDDLAGLEREIRMLRQELREIRQALLEIASQRKSKKVYRPKRQEFDIEDLLREWDNGI